MGCTSLFNVSCCCAKRIIFHPRKAGHRGYNKGSVDGHEPQCCTLLFPDWFDVWICWSAFNRTNKTASNEQLNTLPGTSLFPICEHSRWISVVLIVLHIDETVALALLVPLIPLLLISDMLWEFYKMTLDSCHVPLRRTVSMRMRFKCSWVRGNMGQDLLSRAN